MTCLLTELNEWYFETCVQFTSGDSNKLNNCFVVLFIDSFCEKKNWTAGVFLTKGISLKHLFEKEEKSFQFCKNNKVFYCRCKHAQIFQANKRLAIYIILKRMYATLKVHPPVCCLLLADHRGECTFWMPHNGFIDVDKKYLDTIFKEKIRL